MELDTTDSQIIGLLQEDGRMSNADLAARIHRSESACHRRVRQLENAGVIERYKAVINQAAVGKPANIFVEITLANMLHEWALHDLGHIRQIAELVRARKYLAGAGPLGTEYQLKP